MKKLLSLILILGLFSGCLFDSGAKIKGQVTNLITGESISDAIVIATTSTNIEEDKKYEKKSTKTNERGEFLLKGLSPRYRYKIFVKKPGYSISECFAILPPNVGQTKILSGPIKIANNPPGDSGGYVYSAGKWCNFYEGDLSKRIYNGDIHKGNGIDTLLYVNKEELSNVLRVNKCSTKALVFFSPKLSKTGYGMDLFCLFSFTFFKEWQNKNDILIAGAMNKDGKVAGHTYWKFSYGTSYRDPYVVSYGGYMTGEGCLPTIICKKEDEKKFVVVDISRLRRGIYGITGMKTFFGGKSCGMMAFELI